MKVFELPNANAETTGDSILSFMECAKMEALLPFMKRHGLDNVQRGEWYPLQKWLDVQRDISEEGGGSFDLLAIGMAIPQSAIFPPEISTVEAVVQGWDFSYQMNHRGGDVGKYVVTKISNGFKIVDSTPYPTDISFGVMRGFVKRFRVDNTNYITKYDTSAPSKKYGKETSTFLLTW